MDDRALRNLLDRNEIIDTFNRYAAGIDLRDKKLYRSCFADEVDVDVAGAGFDHMKAEEWVEKAMNAVSVFQSTQHIITNHTFEIAGDEASCVAYLQAQHWKPEGHLLVGGYYTNELARDGDRWVIRRLLLTLTWTENTLA